MKKNKDVSIRSMPTNLWQEVKLQATKRGMSIREYIIMSLKEKVSEKKDG